MKPRVPRSRHLKPNGKRSAYLLLAGGLAWSLLSSGGYAFAQSGPSITGYNVSTLSTAPASVTITGNGFGSSGTVTLNGATLSVSAWSSSTITVNLPNRAQPGPLVVDTGGVSSPSFQFRGWNRGYYSVTQAGVVSTHEYARFFGDLSGKTPSAPIVQLIPTPNAKGYWLLASNGQLYPFGDASFAASPLSSGSAVQFVVLPSGNGGYILSASGKVTAVGQAPAPYGSLSSGTAVGMAMDSAGTGYWILTSTGSVENFGSAASWGSITPPSSGTAKALFANQNGVGGWIVWSTGFIQAVGGAPAFKQPSVPSGAAVTSAAITPNDRGIILQTNSSSGAISSGTVVPQSLPSGVQIAVAAAEEPFSFVSAGYGFFGTTSTSNSSYGDLVSSGNHLKLIQPVWFNPRLTNTTNSTWTISSWLSSSSMSSFIKSVVTQSHLEHVLVMPSVGLYYTPSGSTSTDPLASPQGIQSLVSQIVSLTETYNLDGITIDFENSGFGSIGAAAASSQYTSFIQALGYALHSRGKRLIIAVYPSPYPNSMYNDAQLENYVDWIGVMTYPMHNSSTPPGPTAGFNWQQYWIQQILHTGVQPDKVLLGLAPYAHHWTFSPQAGISPAGSYTTDRAIQQMLTQNSSIKPYWDPTQGEIFFTTGSLAQAPVAPPSVPNGSFVQKSGTAPVYWLHNGNLFHVPNPEIFSALGGQWSQVKSLWELPVASMGLPLDVPFPNGSLVQPSGSPNVYFIWHGVMRHIINPQVFYQMGLEWNDVRGISPLQTTWPVGPDISTASGLTWPTGMLVRQNGTNPVYMVDHGVLRWVTNKSVFTQLGFNFNQIALLGHLPPLPIGTPISSASGVPYATGTLVRLGSHPKVYYVQHGSLRWIPNPSILQGLGFQFQSVISASSFSGLTIGSPVDSVSTSIPVTPPPAWTTLSSSTGGSLPQPVQDLQELLSIVLDIHAIRHGLTPPSFIPLWSDGYYGSFTSSAVQAFQQIAGFSQTSQTGVYNTQTEQALATYIQKYDVGNTIWWDDTTRSTQVRAEWVIANHLAGVDAWRFPFEAPSYFSVLPTNKY